MSNIVSGTLTVYPSSYDSENRSVYSLSYASRAYDSGEEDNYCTIALKRGEGAETYIYFLFDTSSIPANATITSVSCSARVNTNASTNAQAPTRQIQLYSGLQTAKGSPTTITGTATMHTLTCGDWTRAELSDTRIKIYVVRGATNATISRNVQFYGATLTINYTYEEPTQKVYIKQSGSWVEATDTYIKQSGSWVKAESLYIKENGTWKN